MNTPNLLDEIRMHFNPQKARGINSTIQFYLTGDKDSVWTIKIKDQNCFIEPGESTNPVLSVQADMKDLITIFNGKMDISNAFMQGKIKVKGDLRLAMKLLNLFKS